MKKALIYSSCAGQNNKVDRVRLQYNPELGVCELEQSSNILLDKTGCIVSKRTDVLVSSGDFISIYPVTKFGNEFYVVKNRTLDSAIYKCVPNADGTLQFYPLVSGLTKGAKCDFCRLEDEVFYMNGFEKGALTGHSALGWIVSEWPRDTTIPFEVIGTGKHLDVFASRFLYSIDKELFYTESGLYGLIDSEAGRIKFESEIIMIYAVNSGVYISDRNFVYFLEGKNPALWRDNKVLNYPALEYCRIPDFVDSSLCGIETGKPAALFGTVNGPCIGLDNGTPYNLIDKKISLSGMCKSGAIMLVDESLIIQNGV